MCPQPPHGQMALSQPHKVLLPLFCTLLIKVHFLMDYDILIAKGSEKHVPKLPYKGRPFETEIGSNIFQGANTLLTNYQDWLYDLKQLYMSIFEWSGLTEPIDLNVVERWLLEKGSLVFFIDFYIGPLILPYTYLNGLDCYGNPDGVRAYGINGYQAELTRGNYVIIYDNRLKVPALPMLIDYARRLSNIDNAIMINVNSQKTPFLLTAENEAQLTSLKATYNAIQDGKPVIAQVGQAITNGVSAFKTQADAHFIEMQALKESIFNECLSKIGIPNRGRPKAAQVNTEEMMSINGQVIHERNDRLLPRLEAVEQINNLFGAYGININCDFARQLYNYGVADSMIKTPEEVL